MTLEKEDLEGAHRNLEVHPGSGLVDSLFLPSGDYGQSRSSEDPGVTCIRRGRCEDRKNGRID